MSADKPSGLWNKLKQVLRGKPAPKPVRPVITIPEVKIQQTAQGQTAVSRPASTVDVIFLRQQMSNHLDEAQLTAVGAKIEVAFTALPGGKGRKVLALVTAFEKEGKLPYLLQLCQQHNNQIAWQMEHKNE